MEFRRQAGWQFPVGSDEHGSVHRAFGIAVWPTVIIVDRKGRIAYRAAGHRAGEIEQRLAAVLGQ
jgi:peroxiredoxin